MGYKIIGGNCIKHHRPDYPYPIKDMDVLGGDKDGDDNFPELTCFNYDGDYLEKNDIYTLKISHAIRDIKRGKHLKDILFMKSKGCIILEYKLKYLLDYRDNYHGIRDKNFDKYNKDFFDDRISRVIDHDELHRIIMYGNKPGYEYIKNDLDKAGVESSMFDELDDSIKYAICREEPIVIGLERRPGSKMGWQHGVKKCITSLFPSRLSIYCLDNFENIYNEEFKIYYGKMLNKITCN